jgi:hypothetical protein
MAAIQPVSKRAELRMMLTVDAMNFQLFFMLITSISFWCWYHTKEMSSTYRQLIAKL